MSKMFVGIVEIFVAFGAASPSCCPSASSLRIYDIGLEKYYSALLPSSRSNTLTIPCMVQASYVDACSARRLFHQVIHTRAV